MKKHLLSACALALGALLATSAHAQNVAIVNGKPVPTARMDVFVAQIEKQGKPVDDNTRKQIRDEVISREVFMQEAANKGYDSSEDYKNQMEMARQSILIRALFDDFNKKNPVTDAEVKAEYDKFASANGGKEYKARHVLVDKEEEAKAIIAFVCGFLHEHFAADDFVANLFAHLFVNRATLFGHLRHKHVDAGGRYSFAVDYGHVLGRGDGAEQGAKGYSRCGHEVFCHGFPVKFCVW